MRWWALFMMAASGCTPVDRIIELAPGEVRAILTEDWLVLVRGTEDSVELMCRAEAPGPTTCEAEGVVESEAFFLIDPEVACVHAESVNKFTDYRFSVGQPAGSDTCKDQQIRQTCLLKCVRLNKPDLTWVAVKTSTSP